MPLLAAQDDELRAADSRASAAEDAAQLVAAELREAIAEQQRLRRALQVAEDELTALDVSSVTANVSFVLPM
jgi:hypothetical protein